MNFVSYCPSVARASKTQCVLHIFLAILLSIHLAGCGAGVRLSSAVQLAEFENAGPIRPGVGIVTPGDLLELLQMPLVTQARTRERIERAGPMERLGPYLCRVHDDGSITVPIIGQIQAAGRTLAEIEASIIDAYYPKYCVDRPSVVVRVTEYKTALLFTVVGLVNGPGNFPYPPDAQYNFMQALAFAGGLNPVAEPHYATIYRLKGDGAIVSATLKFTDGSKLTDAWTTLIKPGDIVDVAHTPRTRTNLFLQSIFRITVGAFWDPFGDD